MSGSNIDTRETLRLIRRATVFVWPLRYQVAAKLALAVVGISVLLVMPWPLKLLIDYVIMGVPIGDSPTPYPPFVSPLVDLMKGLTPLEVVTVIFVFSFLTIILVGAFGISAAARDGTGANLSQGLDTATRSENMANISDSKVGGLLGLFEYRYQLQTTHRLNHRFRSLLFDRLLALPMTHFSDASVGDAVYRVLYDTPAISRICYEIWVVPFLALYTAAAVIWTTSYCFTAVPSVAWAAWAILPSVFISLLVTGLARRRSAESRAAGTTTTARIEEGMSNIVAVQSLGANKRELARFEDDSAESFKRFRAYMLVVISLIVIQVAIALALIFAVFFDVSEAIIAGKMSAGDYSVLFAYFVLLLEHTGAMGALWFFLQDNVAAMQRVFQIIDLPRDAESHGDLPLQSVKHGIVMENVSFTYPDGTHALSGVNCEGRIGEMIALVGATGAGKSTLAYLMPGFINTNDGRVLIDGADIRRFSIDSLRRNIAFVFQESVVFDDTIEYNIQIGNPDATYEDIEAAARVAGALEFIEKLPDGFQSRVGQAGGTLSVGQKQRLSIARGLVSSAPILILDEPTAALDPETERALLTALNVERERRLLIIIAHRLSTIRTADRIYFLEEGRVLETGNHDELMRRTDGAYKRFVELQFGKVA